MKRRFFLISAFFASVAASFGAKRRKTVSEWLEENGLVLEITTVNQGSDPRFENPHLRHAMCIRDKKSNLVSVTTVMFDIPAEEALQTAKKSLRGMPMKFVHVDYGSPVWDQGPYRPSKKEVIREITVPSDLIPI